MKRSCLLLTLVALAAGCATSSGVMETANGTYIISARAAPARGGTAGANAYAYEEAQKYCAAKQNNSRAVLVNSTERDVYQGSMGASWNRRGGSAGGGVFAAGNATIEFQCVQ